MLRYFLLLVTLSFLSVQAVLSQPSTRRIRIEQILKTLPLLHGPQRIDSLNRLSFLYVRGASSEFDSAGYYSRLATEEAKKLNYKRGYAEGLVHHAEYYLKLIKPEPALQFLRQSLKVAGELDNDSLKSWIYLHTGQALFYQGNFQASIDTFKLLFDAGVKHNNNEWMAESSIRISDLYVCLGEYEKAFAACQQSMMVSNRNSKWDMSHWLIEMGKLYKAVGDYETAMDYYRQVGTLLKPDLHYWPYRNYCISLGNYFKEKKQFDSANHYFKLAGYAYPESIVVNTGFAEVYILQNRNREALDILLKVLDAVNKKGEAIVRMQVLIDIGLAYKGLNQNNEALRYGKEALKLARDKNARIKVRDALLLISEIYEQMNNSASAFQYFREYIRIKDALITDQYKGKLYEFKRIAQDEKQLAEIGLLKKEKRISDQIVRLQQQQLGQNRFLKNILITGIFLIGILSVIIFRYISLKRKNERLKNEKIKSLLEHRTIDLEMQALRSQMNPHFIFNCLTSINRFILKNETDIASDYLTRFSRLIRLVLTHSQSALIPLKDELEMLQLYLDMERLRFKNAFSYEIEIDDYVDVQEVFIPPLLLQPFCENAIWHGLMPREKDGLLRITLYCKNDMLYCTITDNGIGRARAAELSGNGADKKKSFGLKITTERLALFNKDKNGKTSCQVTDILENDGTVGGTKVSLQIKQKGVWEPAVS